MPSARLQALAIAAGLVGAIMFSAVSAPVAATVDEARPGTPPGDIAFEVLREGSELGRHTIRFEQREDELHVFVDIELAVRLGPITLFRYEHENHEVWRDGRLVALDTRTNDDGRTYRVTARATEAGLEVEGADGRLVAPADTLPTSYWNPETVTRGELLDTQRGRIVEVSAEPLPGQYWPSSLTESARGWRLTGDLNLDLWYDTEGKWLGTRFEARGSQVSYRPQRADSLASAGGRR